MVVVTFVLLQQIPLKLKLEVEGPVGWEENVMILRFLLHQFLEASVSEGLSRLSS